MKRLKGVKNYVQCSQLALKKIKQEGLQKTV